ncbi:MAG: endonuclease V [Roseivirga sp.]|nr:endonuclease V [Roseivirga sp.]
MPYYIRQDELKEKIISDVDLELNDLDWIAGCDVGYSEETDQMVGAIVVFDAKTMKTVESATHQMKISFPYIPGLFSYREIPPILHAFEKLKIRPDLIVCDAHGISHPRGIGMASHLGVMLDIPTIGCAKKRLIGAYDKSALKVEKGHSVPLRWNSRDVGAVLRSRADVKPVFVSIGHKINLESSIAIILELCQKYRLPETTRHADRLVNQILKSRTGIEDI